MSGISRRSLRLMTVPLEKSCNAQMAPTGNPLEAPLLVSILTVE